MSKDITWSGRKMMNKKVIKFIHRYVEDMGGKPLNKDNMKESEIFLDATNLMFDIIDMLEKKYPNVSIRDE